MPAQRLLVLLLRLIAASASLAIVPVFMPHRWMDLIHGWLGLGTLPETPVIVYLTRSLSAMYAFHAAVLWIVARDVVRYAAIVAVLGWAFVAFGIVVTWIDFHAGLPWFWTAAEGPASLFVGLAVLVLRRRKATSLEE